MSNEFIEEYNAYLAGEISAVETYDIALKNVSTPNYQRAVQEGRMSHEKSRQQIACSSNRTRR